VHGQLAGVRHLLQTQVLLLSKQKRSQLFEGAQWLMAVSVAVGHDKVQAGQLARVRLCNLLQTQVLLLNTTASCAC
jgi:hypothetical protein